MTQNEAWRCQTAAGGENVAAASQAYKKINKRFDIGKRLMGT